MTSANFQQLANFIWSVADLLRGPYRPPQYERVMLPFIVLRRFDAVLAPSKEAVLQKYRTLEGKDETVVDRILNETAKDENGKPLGFHNHSSMDFRKLKGDPDNVADHLLDYIHKGFSRNIREIFENFEFDKEVEKLKSANRLYQVVAQFAEIDLHPSRVDNITMGLVFEDLIRRFNEAANETAGDHFTPREVIHMMVNLMLEPDTDSLTQEGKIITILDPACGTGGMLAESQNWIREHNEDATVKVYGQDYNERSYAIAASDLLIKGYSDSQIRLGNTLTEDRFEGQRFDYLIANPPFGVDWKGEKKEIDSWPNFRGYSGKLPRVNDGALLFLLHMISKFQPFEAGNMDRPGTRLAIVFNGSPLFTGGAGSGESEIRRWIIENDWLEAIVALPEQMFYNTGIGTFVWVLSNRKEQERKGVIQLIDARERWTPMKRSLGNKRRYLEQAAIDEITREHGGMPQSATSKLFANDYFGYRRVTIQRPLRLRFQITPEAKERYLDTYPELLDAILAIEEHFGEEPQLDWNLVWKRVQQIVKKLPDNMEGWGSGARGTRQKKSFREAFTETDPEAEPVVAKVHKSVDVDPGALFPCQQLPELEREELPRLLGLHPDGKGNHIEYENDSALRDQENIPLQEDVVSFVRREVLPYVADAWVDRESLDEKDNGIGKVGYEINFNREFFVYKAPRPLEEIDSELEAVEKRIMELLREVTE
ncbi:MAG: class I SAM-dependent DNA methyltransferase [bacterium]